MWPYPSWNDVVSCLFCMSVYERTHQDNIMFSEWTLGYNEIKNCPWTKHPLNEIWRNEAKKDILYVLFLLYVLMHCRSWKNFTQQEKDIFVSSDFLKIRCLHLNLNNFWAQLCIFLYKLDKPDNISLKHIAICFSLKKCY